MNDTNTYQYVFGPVPSRRLGSSLGVDIVPFKTCTYDCVYCQLGRTTRKTCKRQMFYPVQEILTELEKKLPYIPETDYITLSGSGEPTLHEGLGDIIDGIKNITDIKVAVLTNGSLLWQQEVRRSIMDADLIIPSLDAGNEVTFHRINRPHPDITFNKMVKGLLLLRDEFSGPIWLEVFIVNTISDNKQQLRKLKDILKHIKPDRIQLNTAIRGGAEYFVEAVSMEEMEEIRQYIGHDCEIISHGNKTYDQPLHETRQEDILNLVKRRPCTIDDLASGLKIHRNEAIKYVNALKERNIITAKRSEKRILYAVRDTYRKETFIRR